MKKYICFILALVFPLVLSAQTKSQVTSDITYTMSDFMSDVSCLNEDPEYVMQNIESVSTTFGSPDYFLFNGRQMDSFKAWLESYCNEWFRQGYVEHQLQIKQQTIEKVDAKEDRDKRYRFDAVLARKYAVSGNDEIPVSFIIEWKGDGQYVTILEIKGELITAPQVNLHKTVANHSLQTYAATTVQETEDSFQWTRDYTFLTIGASLIFLWLLCCWYYGSNTEFHLTFLFWLAVTAVIYFWPKFSPPKKFDEAVVAQYEDWFRVDSLGIAAVKKDGKWGLIDYDGEVIMKPYADTIHAFHNELAVVKWNFEYHYVNPKGEKAFRNYSQLFYGNFKEATDFRGEKALIRSRNKTYEIIDTKGKTVRKLPYTQIQKFQDGYAKVQTDKLYGYIRQSDFKEVIPVMYDNVSSVSHGHFGVSKDGKWGLVDSLNNTAIPFQYDHVATRGNRCILWDSKNRKDAMTDLAGNIIVPFSNYDLSFHTDKLVRVKDRSSRQGLMDMDGNWIMKLDKVGIHFFEEDRAVISRNFKKYGFIDTEGKVVIPMKYDNASNFSNGLARVKVGDKWGAINKQGKTVIPLQYDGMGDYIEGLMPAKKGKKWGYVNEKNETIIPFMYDYAFEFGENTISGCAKVEKNKLYGIIDKQNQTIIPFEYSSLLYWGNYIVAKRNGKYGILDRKGNPKSAFEFDNIIRADGNVYTVAKDGQTFGIEIK